MSMILMNGWFEYSHLNKCFVLYSGIGVMN